MVYPKKYLGQHFLTDPSVARRIVDSLETGPGELVLEVGPGTGVLTGLLMEKGVRLLPVEIDPESVRHLLARWPELKGKLIEGDFLNLDIRSLTGGTIHVIGNFPYNISSQILFKILENRQPPLYACCRKRWPTGSLLPPVPGSMGS
jgi:16S rRNA (adenine1518-N6/adenine1519-N6)-dimethyltransferase